MESQLCKQVEEEAEDDVTINALIKENRRISNELMEVWKVLINHLKDKLQSPTTIGVKRMGEIDFKPFLEACKNGKDPQFEAMTACSSWNKHIVDSRWNPLKIVDGVQVIDRNDGKLIELENQMGKDVYKAVTEALLEINEYNPSGRYPVPEFWNFAEGKKVSLNEVLEFVMEE